MEEIKLVKQAEALGKSEFKIVETDGVKYLLCGSPLAFSDLIDGRLYDFVRSIAFQFTSELDNDGIPDEDNNSKAVEAVEEVVLGLIGCKEVIYGSVEF